MAATELRNTIRSMSPGETAITLAVAVVMDRIERLSKEDRDDLFALVKELGVAETDDDRDGICKTMVEILEGCPAVLQHADLSESGAQSKWNDWVSRKIRDARLETGMTQDQLAEKSGLPQSHISRIENAKLSPSRTTIEKIAIALGKPLTFFDFN